MDTTLMAGEIEFEEGRVSAVYKDSEGYLTIGVGRLVDARKGGRLSNAEIDMLLANDIASHTLDLDARLPWWRVLSDVRQRVLVNMCFQLGIDGLLKFTTTLTYIHNQRYEDAAKAMLLSDWAKQTPARAKRMADRMRDDHV